MKVNKNLVRELAIAVRTKGLSEDSTGLNGEHFKIFYMEDVTVTFLLKENAEAPEFFGASFAALGRDFSILNDLGLYIALPDEANEDEEEIYEITEEPLIRHLERFLAWRISAMRTFSL